MGTLITRRRAAIQAVARHFSQAFELRRALIDVALITRGSSASARVAKPRIRFDKVAQRVIADLRDDMCDLIPDGKAVLVTVTAPIRLPSKTVAALGERIRSALSSRSRAEFEETLSGNHVHVRIVNCDLPSTSKLLGFVHNADSDPEIVLDAAQALIAGIEVEIGSGRGSAFKGNRWLVIADAAGVTPADVYRHAYAQLFVRNTFEKAVLLCADGTIEDITP